MDIKSFEQPVLKLRQAFPSFHNMSNLRSFLRTHLKSPASLNPDRLKRSRCRLLALCHPKRVGGEAELYRAVAQWFEQLQNTDTAWYDLQTQPLCTLKCQKSDQDQLPPSPLRVTTTTVRPPKPAGQNLSKKQVFAEVMQSLASEGWVSRSRVINECLERVPTARRNWQSYLTRFSRKIPPSFNVEAEKRKNLWYFRYRERNGCNT